MLLQVLKPEFARHCTHHRGIVEDAAHHVVYRSLMRVTVDSELARHLKLVPIMVEDLRHVMQSIVVISLYL